MQLVKPIDIEDALRVDLAAILGSSYKCFAPPQPDDLTAGSVMVTALGGASNGEVSNEHDVSIDCWASTEAAAVTLGNTVAGYVASLPMRATTTPYKGAYINALPYINPDPTRPLLPRVTFRATVTVRGGALY